ncbi:hypothetical protein [Streptomyces sp. NPDC005167]
MVAVTGAGRGIGRAVALAAAAQGARVVRRPRRVRHDSPRPRGRGRGRLLTPDSATPAPSSRNTLAMKHPLPRLTTT